nr:uncharacterized protein LOC110791648 [Spinacia oleracea]
MDAHNNKNDGTSSNQDIDKLDPQRLRRLHLNRLYAQRFRYRKQVCLQELEKEETELKVKVAMLYPQVAFYKAQVAALQKENAELRQEIAILEAEALFANARLDDLKAEKSALMTYLGINWEPNNGYNPTDGL